jgi:hypothetical protein
LHRASHDAHSVQPHIRTEARGFWGDGKAVAFWYDLLGVDSAQFQRWVQHSLTR